MIYDAISSLIDTVKATSIQEATDQQHVGVLFMLAGEQVNISGFAPGMPPRDFLKVALAIEKPDAYVTIVEGRMLTGVTDDGLKDYQYGEIGSNPDNPTVLLIGSAVNGGRVQGWICEALKESFPRQFTPWRPIEGDMVGGLVQTQW